MRYAISDIHGGSRTFRALLDRLDLKHTDRLYLLGDYVDRGNDSKGVLDTIWNLINAGYDVRPIRGNHDDMFHRVLMGDHDQFSQFWYGSWGANTLASIRCARCNRSPAQVSHATRCSADVCFR